MLDLLSPTGGIGGLSLGAIFKFCGSWSRWASWLRFPSYACCGLLKRVSSSVVSPMCAACTVHCC